MKKLKMSTQSLTFEEGCNKYLEYCRQRNLREGTVNHYRQSYLHFYKFFDPKMPVEDIDEKAYKDYVLHLKKTLHNDVSINSYLRDLITTVHFFMNEGYLPHFKMQAINVDKSHIETYSEGELQLLLKKPNSNYIADLPVYHRTPVARYENRDFLGDVQFGVWYIRLRDKRRTQTPFDGVVKVEKIMMDEEIEKGIDSDVIDLISANIINERNPTCYGTDRRWANHLYPVFLTESYVKSKYISTEMFLHLF